MRTVILVAAFCLCDSIEKGWVNHYPDGLMAFITVVFFISIIMDLAEFIKKLNS